MTLWQHSLVQQSDQNGRPDQWTATFYVAGTSTKATTFKDSAFTAPHPLTVNADSWGRLPAIFLKPDGVQLDCRIAYGDGRVAEIKGIDPGSPVTPSLTTATPSTPVVSKSGVTITLTAADAGRVINVATASGANAAVYLPKSNTVADGLPIILRNNGLGAVVIRPSPGDLINNVTGAVLTEDQETLSLVSSGAGYDITTRTPQAPKRVLVRNRSLTTPPAIVNAGDSYLAGATAGGWTINAIMTADGSGGWLTQRPAIGDTVIVEAETTTTSAGTAKLELTWSGTEWLPSSKRLAQVAVFKDEHVSGTGSLAAHGGVSPAAAFWTRNILNTVAANGIAGATLTSNIITLPRGSYRVTARRRLKGAISGKLMFRNISGSTFIKGMPIYLAANEQGVADLDGSFTVTAETETCELVFILSGTVGATTLGDASAIAGETEVYAEVAIQTLSVA